MGWGLPVLGDAAVICKKTEVLLLQMPGQVYGC